MAHWGSGGGDWALEEVGRGQPTGDQEEGRPLMVSEPNSISIDEVFPMGQMLC